MGEILEMGKSPIELETEICKILELPLPEVKPKKRGRRPKPPTPVWSLDFYNPAGNMSFALISMCIKEDFEQSIEQLALRLSIWKMRPPRECLSVLRRLRRSGKLGYYDKDHVFRTWNGEEDGYGLEIMRR